MWDRPFTGTPPGLLGGKDKAEAVTRLRRGPSTSPPHYSPLPSGPLFTAVSLHSNPNYSPCAESGTITGDETGEGASGTSYLQSGRSGQGPWLADHAGCGRIPAPGSLLTEPFYFVEDPNEQGPGEPPGFREKSSAKSSTVQTAHSSPEEH